MEGEGEVVVRTGVEVYHTLLTLGGTSTLELTGERNILHCAATRNLPTLSNAEASRQKERSRGSGGERGGQRQRQREMMPTTI